MRIHFYTRDDDISTLQREEVAQQRAPLPRRKRIRLING